MYPTSRQQRFWGPLPYPNHNFGVSLTQESNLARSGHFFEWQKVFFDGKWRTIWKVRPDGLLQIEGMKMLVSPHALPLPRR
jgi:hypothetical protein